MYLASGKKITVAGELTGPAISFTMADRKGVFTDTAGENIEYNVIEKFTSEAGYDIFKKAADEDNPGQLYMGKQVVLSFDANGASGAAPEAVTYWDEDTVTVPGQGVLTYGDGISFNGWNTKADGSGTAYAEGDMFTISADTTLYAQWIHTHDGITFQTWSSNDSMPTSSGNYVLTGDVTLSSTWKIDANTTINLCLNGHSIIQNSNNPVIEIWALYRQNPGTLNLYDCAENGSGSITHVDKDLWVHVYIICDVNGDGVVNNKDVTRLMRYIKYNDVEVVEPALDINGDGEVNNKDVTRLMRWIKYQDVEVF